MEKKFHRIWKNGKERMQNKAFIWNRKKDKEKSANQSNKNKQKNVKAIIAIALAVTVIAGGVFAFYNHGKRAMAGENRVMESKVQKGNLSQTVEGMGTLANASSESLDIPTGLKIKKVKVSEGDEVKKGDTLATVDETSLLAKLAQTQEALDELNHELSDEAGSSTSKYVKASVDGRIKKIYASKNKAVADTVLDKGALMLISLDGKMAVKMSTSKKLTVGQSVKVTLSSGSSVTGTVTKSSDTSCTITVTDKGTKYKDKVTAYTSSGKKIGTGKLYINKEAKVTAISGTVSSILVSENESVSEGDKLLKLKGDFQSEEYLSLQAEKEDLEESLTLLLEIAKNNTITAKSSGVITGICVSENTESGSTSDSNTSSSSSNSTSGSTSTSGSSSGVTATKTSSTNTSSSSVKAVTLSTKQNQTNLNTNFISTGQSASQGELKLLSVSTGNSQSSESATNATEEVESKESTESTTEATTQATTESKSETSTTTTETTKGNTGASTQTKQNTTTESSKKASTQKKEAKTPTGSNGQSPSNASSAKNASGQSSMNKAPSVANTTSGSGKSAGISSSSVSKSTATSSSSSNSASTSSSTNSNTNTELTTAFSVAAMDEMTVCVNVDEMDILSIKNGQKATITFDAIENKEYEGKITSIDRNGTTSNGTTKYPVEITVDKEDSMMLGMNASVTITTSEVSDVLLVPAAAITEEGNTSYVYTQKDSKSGELSGKIQVETGDTDGTNVAITSGLSEGDTVYYSMTSSDSSDSSNNDQKKQDMKMNGNFGGGQRGGNGGGTPPSGGGPGGNN